MAHDWTSADGDHVENLRLPETSSRCITESVSATHNFEVASYPLLEGMGVGKFVSSSEFSAGGYGWCVRFYPDGATKDCAGNASVYLCYLSQAKHVVRAKFTLTMLEKQGKVQVTADKGQQGHEFSRTHPDWGFPKFVEKSRLLESSSSRLDVGGYLTIRCELTVIKPPRTVCRKDLVVVPPVELPGHLARVLKEGTGADVTFRMGCRTFDAHRIILAAQSPVFEKQFFGPMKVKDTRSIEVVDMEPDIFEMLLHFVYTDSLPPCDGDRDGEGHSSAGMQHLLVAADRYGMSRLKLICEEMLCESIDVETITTTYVLSIQHECERLKQSCLDFISSPEVTDAVLESDGFKHLLASWSLLEKRRGNKVAQK